jgi:hypothetical protein
MTAKAPRHSTISANPRDAAQQNSENARDTTEALGAKLTARMVTVERYTAVGNITARIPIGSSSRPLAVVLARAAAVYAQDATLAAYGTPNFVWEATTRSVNAFEPSGLVAGTVYQLSYILVEV